ncbi:MAG: hypothetical protein AAF563_20465 [Pseudomonadota bacterium]
MAGLPTITVTWGELFDRIADLEQASEQVTEPNDRIGLEAQLEPLREQARADAPGAVHAVASELKDVIREIVRLDAEIAIALRDDTGAVAALVDDHRDQCAKRRELRNSIDHLMRNNREGQDG